MQDSPKSFVEVTLTVMVEVPEETRVNLRRGEPATYTAFEHDLLEALTRTDTWFVAKDLHIDSIDDAQ
jgi:hypothetical protein